LLIKLSDDLREQQAIQQEVKASISMYVLLIFFGAGIGGPLLLGISTFIVEALQAQASTTGIETTLSELPSQVAATQFVGVPKTQIDPGFILMFASILVFVSSLMSSFAIGAINSGKEKNGLKFFPLILILSFMVFFGARAMLSTMFADVLG
jgi:hypothetical protein